MDFCGRIDLVTILVVIGERKSPMEKSEAFFPSSGAHDGRMPSPPALRDLPVQVQSNSHLLHGFVVAVHVISVMAPMTLAISRCYVDDGNPCFPISDQKENTQESFHLFLVLSLGVSYRFVRGQCS
jgi:hypothetical protein